MPSDTPPTAEPRSTWHAPIALALAVFALRVVYLVALSPYELVDDEAHYWEWSRRPALSYYTKGPGVAWTIWVGTHLLGHTELGVRIGSAVAGLVAMVGMAVLAARASRSWRVATLAVAALALTSVFQAIGFLMTIDGPYVASWIWAAALGRELAAQWRNGRDGLGVACALGAAIGIGFLYKYTIVLLVPGLAWYLLRLTDVRGIRLARARPLLLASGAFIVAILPVIAWNHLRGWPTVSHLLGRIQAPGGDVPTRPWRYAPAWTLEYLGIQIGILGPIAFGMIVASLRWAWRERHRDPVAWDERRLMIALAAPIFAFYLALSFASKVQGNWAFAGFATLFVPMAEWVAAGGRSARRAWRWMVGYGVVSALLLLAMPALPALFGLPESWTPLYRLTGRRALADGVQAELDAIAAAEGAVPPVVANYYTRASSLAFYLRDQPRVWCASEALGSRRTAYEDFEDTRLDDPALRGRTCVLVGSEEARWRTAFAPTELRLLRRIDVHGRTTDVFRAVLPPVPPEAAAQR